MSLYGYPLGDITFPAGFSAQRPTAPPVGAQFFDIDYGRPIYWNGTAWVTAAGTPLPLDGLYPDIAAGLMFHYDARDLRGHGQLTLPNRATGAVATIGDSASEPTNAPDVVLGPPQKLVVDGVEGVLQPPEDRPTHVTPTEGAFTLLVIQASFTTGTTQALWSASPGGYDGIVLYETSGTTLVATVRPEGVTSGATQAGGAAGGDGVIRGKGMVINAGTLRAYASGIGLSASVDISGLASIGMGTHPRLASSRGSTGYLFSRHGDYHAWLGWDRALTATELNTVSAYLVEQFT